MGIIIIMFAASPYAYGAGFGAYGAAPYGAYGAGLGWFNQKGGQHGQHPQLQELHGGMPGLQNENTYLHQNVFGGVSGFSNGLPPHNTYMHSDVTGMSTASNPFFGGMTAARTTFPGVPTAGAMGGLY